MVLFDIVCVIMFTEKMCFLQEDLKYKSTRLKDEPGTNNAPLYFVLFLDGLFMNQTP